MRLIRFDWSNYCSWGFWKQLTPLVTFLTIICVLCDYEIEIAWGYTFESLQKYLQPSLLFSPEATSKQYSFQLFSIPLSFPNDSVFEVCSSHCHASQRGRVFALLTFGGFILTQLNISIICVPMYTFVELQATSHSSRQCVTFGKVWVTEIASDFVGDISRPLAQHLASSVSNEDYRKTAPPGSATNLFEACRADRRWRSLDSRSDPSHRTGNNCIRQSGQGPVIVSWFCKMSS